MYFAWEKCIQCAYGVFLHCTKCALNYRCFIQRYHCDPAMYNTLPAAIMQPDTLFSIYESFKLLFQYNIVVKASVFYMGKVHIVCIWFVLVLHKMRVESRLFYLTISLRSCHVQHTTCNHNAAGHSILIYKSFKMLFQHYIVL